MKSVIELFVKVIIALFLMVSFSTYGQNFVRKDIYGREIINSSGKRINYTKSDLELVNKDLLSTKINSTSQVNQQSNCLKDTLNLSVENLYSVMGTSIGRNSMHSIDIDKDGICELICTASAQTFGDADYWYIMHYNSSDSTCNQLWTSFQYINKIATLEVVDFNNDNNYKIVLGFKNGTIEIYDALTKELIKKVAVSTESINSIIYADADNDSQNDIIISCEANTYILNAITLTQKYKINKGAKYVRVGNVDSDLLNEIVLSSGIIYELNGSALATEWVFNTSGEGCVELSDIDNDSKKEIIFAELWQYIRVYDADNKTTKYSITTTHDISTLLLKDVNNDGVDEILYGDGQWGKVNCYNSVTQTKIWSVNNPDHSITAINIADLDNDGNQELIWGAGWTSTGADYLYIYNIQENKLRWRSADIVGPFYALAIGDVDDDGKKEIVGVSYESESGYGSGVILIIDAKTNQLKWKSSGTFLKQVWTGLFNVSIIDVDNDGKNEIIIAAGQTYTGEIWIIDGKNHTIKTSHIFTSENINEFYSLNVEDVDSDGKLELIVTNSSSLYVINPLDWSIKWSVNISSNYSKPIVRCADVNGDGKKEVIVCKGTIQVINSVDHSTWSSQEINYVNIDIFDFNADGVLDIVASTLLGHIVAIDGKLKSKLNDINPENVEISSVRLLKYDGLILYLYSCNGRINMYQNESNCIVSKNFGSKIGEIESLKIFEYKPDSVFVLISTPISIIKTPLNLIESCASLFVNAEKNEASCTVNDGRILLNITGGASPYTYKWNDNTTLDRLGNLSEGIYSVMVKDKFGCQKKRIFNVTKAYLSADIQANDEGCTEKGSIIVNINHITPPYTINWSNAQTQLNNTNLSAGDYRLIISDSKNCIFDRTTKINKDTIIVRPYINNVSCHGYSNGLIRLERLSGREPLTYKWDSGNTNYMESGLKVGSYAVSIEDALGCESKLKFQITQPDTITYKVLVNPDDLNTNYWEGKVMINDITGGTPPYQVYWPRFLKNADYIDLLAVGEYIFVVSDAKNCQVIDTARIGSTLTGIQHVDLADFQVYPIPAKYELFLSAKSDDILSFNFEIVNQYGEIVRKGVDISSKTERVNLVGLVSGFYVLKLRYNNSNFYKKIIIE